MSFIPVNLNDAQEAKPVPGGRYDLVISSCEEVLNKKQQPMFKIILNIEGHDEAPPVYNYLNIPDPAGDEDGGKMKALMLRRFLDLFKIPYSDAGFDTEKIAQEMPGARASGVELQQEEYNDNLSNKIMVPRLKSDGGKGTGKPPTAAKKA